MTRRDQYNLSGLPCMRGKAFHNYLVGLADDAFRRTGFDVRLEYGLKLSDGKADYVDLLAQREGLAIICEIETTPRHVLDNLAKAELLDMPVWVVVPSRKVKAKVIRKLQRAGYKSRKEPFQISLPNELQQRLTAYFSSFSPANTSGENGKTKKGTQ